LTDSRAGVLYSKEEGDEFLNPYKNSTTKGRGRDKGVSVWSNYQRRPEGKGRKRRREKKKIRGNMPVLGLRGGKRKNLDMGVW